MQDMSSSSKSILFTYTVNQQFYWVTPLQCMSSNILLQVPRNVSTTEFAEDKG